MVEERQSLVCVKENVFTKLSKFIKRIFKKDSEQLNSSCEVDIKESNNYIKHNREELMEIYNKAKKNEYDLTTLNVDEIMVLIDLIKEEISIKKEKLEKAM